MPPAFLLILYSQAGDVLSVSDATLLQKHTSASLINLRCRAPVFDAGKDAASAIQMLVCIVTAIDPEVEKAEIVFDGREITSVPCLFKVITCGGVFNQSAVNVISAPFGIAEIL